VLFRTEDGSLGLSTWREGGVREGGVQVGGGGYEVALGGWRRRRGVKRAIIGNVESARKRHYVKMLQEAHAESLHGTAQD